MRGRVGKRAVECESMEEDHAAGLAVAPRDLLGGWHADSVSMTLPDGTRKMLAATDHPISVIISEKKLTLRLGDKVLADMSYVLDPGQSPCAIDLTSDAGKMLGICRWKGDVLTIGMNDQAQGRPRDFDKAKNSMVLVLRRFAGYSLFVVDADGANRHPIVSMPDFTFVGSPDWSRDGKKIAFDGWQSIFGEGLGETHIFVANADGSDRKDVAIGAMPSWSPDGKLLTYCRYGENQGVWIMNADGSAPRQISSQGWGSQWSPKRNEIAYTSYDGGSAVLTLYDVEKNEHHPLQHKPYRQIYWGVSWSPDGKWICFKGVTPDGDSELAGSPSKGRRRDSKCSCPTPPCPMSRTTTTRLPGAVRAIKSSSRCRPRPTPCSVSTFSISPARRPPVYSPSFRRVCSARTWPGRRTERKRFSPPARRIHARYGSSFAGIALIAFFT